jgi:hypothetical protein
MRELHEALTGLSNVLYDSFGEFDLREDGSDGPGNLRMQLQGIREGIDRIAAALDRLSPPPPCQPAVNPARMGAV